MIQHLIYILFVISFTCCTWSSETATSKEKLIFKFQSQSYEIEKEQLPLKWKVINREDPNSDQEMTYKGFDFLSVLSHLQEQVPATKNFESIKVSTKDGYTVYISNEKLKRHSPFLALEVVHSNPKGIYNKRLKTYFDWRPSYLVFFKNEGSHPPSSPYQIVQIEILKQNKDKKILSQVPPSHKEGAKVFLRSCNRCHSYLEEGGTKAPPISYLTSKYKTDSLLKDFLRSPQKIANRPIEMSAFEGSQKELKDLISFLRSIEITLGE